MAAVAFLGARLVNGVGAYALLAVGVAATLFTVFVTAYALLFAAALVVVVLVAALVSSRVRGWFAPPRLRAAARRLPLHVPARIVLEWFLWLRAIARRERVAVAAHRGADVAVAYRPLPDGDGPRLRTLVADPATWRDLVHLVVTPLVVAAGCLAALLVGAAALAALADPPIWGPGPGPTVRPWEDVRAWAPSTWASIVAAVVVLALLPLVVRWLADGVARLGAALLSTGERARMRAELDEQRLRRQLAVEAAEVERRRIERDLHDGAQQRLVALGMNLGLARETLPHDPVAGAALVAEAHEEAKRALDELRDLARGIHPAILADRGLDAALSALARRSGVPVHILVSLPSRPPSSVESAAYFVVAETLTNVTRHAAASHATVTITAEGDAVVVEVGDDGVGGADPARGTGLAGLRDRLVGLGGRLLVESPTGGPTTVRGEIPCAS